MSATKSNFNFTVTSATSITSYAVSNFTIPTFTGGFSNESFWDAFIKKNNVKDEEDLVTKVLDISRSHFGPDAKNWPGMTIGVTYTGGTGGTWSIILPAGKTTCQATQRGQSSYSWTSMCLATAAVFEEVYRQSDKVDTGKINGNWQGATQYQTTLPGYTTDHYDKCQNALSSWLTSVGQKARDSAIANKVRSAAVQTITNRTDMTCAWKISNIARYLNGENVATGAAEIITFKETEVAFP